MELLKRIDAAAIEGAARELPAEVLETPLLLSPELSEVVGHTVWLKTENLQVTGSYKARAAWTVLNRLPAEARRRGAAISSSGNFAAAWAYMGRLLGIPAIVVMPEATSPVKVERARRAGAEVVFCADFQARWETLERLERERGITVVNTFESVDVVLGHGTVGMEIASQPVAGTVLVPASSGGLLAGVGAAVKDLMRVVGIQPEGSRALYDSFRAGRVVHAERVETVCDSLVASYPGRLPLACILRDVEDVALVAEEDVVRAVAWLATRARLVVEAGGAVGVAALLSGRVRVEGPTVVLLSGGNIAPETLAKYVAAGAA